MIFHSRKNNDSGFSAIEGILVLLVLLALGGLGWYILNQNKDGNSGKQVDSSEYNDLAKYHNQFGIDVFKHLNTDTDNLMISPTSIHLALSMVYNGANGDTASAMAKSMGVDGQDINKLNEQSLALIESMENPDENVELKIANSAWISDQFEVKTDYTNVIEKYYKAEISTLNFQDPETPNTINSWVDENTNGKITKIIGKIDPEMVMYLINATYFKGTWTKEFNPDNTLEKTFTTSDGQQIQHPLMSRDDEMDYYEKDNFQAVKLPYGKNKKISFTVILPSDANDYINNLTLEQWSEIQKGLEEKEGHLELPKFVSEYETSLMDVLDTLGMGIAFSDMADFSKISDQPIKISEAKHKTFIDVNEEGTEAAAVTSIGEGTTSVQEPPERFSMIVDRPFIYAITEEATGEILFIGAIKNPSN